MAVTLIALFGSGDRMVSLIKVTGPTSYTAITAGTPPAGPTGGQDIPASAFGLKYINICLAGLDQSGKYEVAPLPNGGAGVAVKATLMWKLAVTGAETSGDLHTYTVHLMAIGR